MKSIELFKRGTVLSYEVFPPRPNSPLDSIYKALQGLKELNPDFVSVTYGAGGNGNAHRTFEIASAVKRCGMDSVVHLPCIGLKKQDVLTILDKLKALDINNILALRGDIPAGGTPNGDFKYASELIAFIKDHGDFNIMAACYPEGHVESKNKVEDIRNLKIKVDAGAESLISQLFFDNNSFYEFQERCQLAGIDVPVEAGIMPVVNKRQIERITSLCGASIPKKFASMMARYEHNALAMRDAGIAYAVDQIVDLITNGVDGIHLYTMNNPYIAKKIHEAIHNLVHSERLDGAA